MRCMQCGFPNDTRTTGYSKNGEGYTGEPSVVTDSKTESGGCGFCASLHWLPYKPDALPDDRLLSDGHVKRNGR